MIPRVLREKFGRRFDTLDVAGTGTVRQAEYEAYVDRIATAAGRSSDESSVVRLREVYLALWADMTRRAGLPALTRDQYIQALHDSIIANADGVERVFEPLVSALMAIVDSNGDGVLDRKEFGHWMGAYGLTHEQAAESFTHLDRDGDGALSIQELVSAFHEFYLSEDPAVAGNWLLGPLPTWLTSGSDPCAVPTAGGLSNNSADGVGAD